MDETSISAAVWLQVVALGGIMGMVGQIFRLAPGLKKLSEQAVASNSTFAKEFSFSVFTTTLILSFAVGVAAALSMSGKFMPDGKASVELLLSIMAIGYGGTDFIEGFVRKYLPK